MSIACITFFSIIFEFYIVNLYFSKFSSLRVSKLTFALLCCVFIAFQFSSNQYFLAKSALVLLCSFAFIFLCSLPYEINFLSRIFSVAFIFLLSALSECIVAMLLTTILKIDLEKTQTDLLLYALCTLTSKFLALAIVLILRFDKKKKLDWLPSSFAVKVIPLPLATFFILILLFFYSYFLKDYVFDNADLPSSEFLTVSYFRIMTLVASVLLIIANIFIFYIIDKQNDYIKTKESLTFAQEHIKNQIAHYTELYAYQNELKTFKHDLKNRLVALSALLQNGNSDKVLELIKTDIDFLNNSNQTIVNSGNPVVDAVIQTKLRYALKNNVKIKTVFKLSENVNINEFELGVLIGNALDNAIEATIKIAEDKRQPIAVMLLTSEGQLSFSTENSVTESADINALKTSKDDKLNHGYGLNSMKSIARKYDGEIFTECENGRFHLAISLANRK